MAFLAAAQANPNVKRIVTVATESAMRDILQSIVDRSAKIAAIATREMVMKDFAMEPDENKMRKAAHLMVQNLASSLALVAYKDPLRTRCDCAHYTMAKTKFVD